MAYMDILGVIIFYHSVWWTGIYFLFVGLYWEECEACDYKVNVKYASTKTLKKRKKGEWKKKGGKCNYTRIVAMNYMKCLYANKNLFIKRPRT